jgi:hypothetical protein
VGTAPGSSLGVEDDEVPETFDHRLATPIEIRIRA